MKELNICVNNKNYESSLDRWKVYRAIKDDRAKERGFLRVIDEPGEDYLFPSDYFMPISLPKTVQDAMT